MPLFYRWSVDQGDETVTVSVYRRRGDAEPCRKIQVSLAHFATAEAIEAEAVRYVESVRGEIETEAAEDARRLAELERIRSIGADLRENEPDAPIAV